MCERAQIPVRRPENLETTSLGAAFAAGIGAGFWAREWVLHQEDSGSADEFRPKVQATISAAWAAHTSAWDIPPSASCLCVVPGLRRMLEWCWLC